MEADGVKEDGYEKALDQANAEFKQLYTSKMKYLKKTDDRVTAAKMVIMRARDIEREANNGNGVPQFVFNLVAYDFENMLWLKCPGCGNPEIHQESNGVKWKGCYKCRVLLDDKKAQIRSMLPPGAKKPKQEPW
jgi:hypothetical protein